MYKKISSVNIYKNVWEKFKCDIFMVIDHNVAENRYKNKVGM